MYALVVDKKTYQSYEKIKSLMHIDADYIRDLSIEGILFRENPYPFKMYPLIAPDETKYIVLDFGATTKLDDDDVKFLHSFLLFFLFDNSKETWEEVDNSTQENSITLELDNKYKTYQIRR